MHKTPQRHLDKPFPFPLAPPRLRAGGSSWYLFRLAATFSVFGLPSRLRFSLVGSPCHAASISYFFSPCAGMCQAAHAKTHRTRPGTRHPGVRRDCDHHDCVVACLACGTYEARGMCCAPVLLLMLQYSTCNVFPCSRALTRAEIAFIPAGGLLFLCPTHKRKETAGLVFDARSGMRVVDPAQTLYP